MKKIRKIEFKNNAIFKNLCIDLSLKDGSIPDVVVAAGENGCGKSSFLNAIYKIFSYKADFEVSLEVDVDGSEFWFDIVNNGSGYLMKKRGDTKFIFCNGALPDKGDFGFRSIYEVTGVNFNANSQSSTKAEVVDKDDRSKQFNNSTVDNLNQLIIDVQTSDDEKLANDYRNCREKKQDTNLIKCDGNMARFKKAFDAMFSSSNLKYEGIHNEDNVKKILFSKGKNNKFDISKLSSGEKQIVYRACFLLKDINKIKEKSPIVLIDEPEVSLHPEWQIKTLDYYTNLISDSTNSQFSQIFFSTHSDHIIESTFNKKKSIVLYFYRENNDIKYKKFDLPFVLPTLCASEINYFVFNLPTYDYHIHLFSSIQEKLINIHGDYYKTLKKVDDYIDDYLTRNNLPQFKGPWRSDDSHYTYKTLPYWIRNVIDHPENNHTPIPLEKLRESIDLLIEIYRSIH